MAVVQLATEEDVVAVLGRDLTDDELARVNAILDKASELFRAESGQVFTGGTSEVRLRVRDVDTVLLPQRPVISVDTITDDDGNDLEFTLYKQAVTLEDTSVRWVRVEYTHGGDVPDAVRLAVAEIAAVVLRIDSSAQAGMSQVQETTGPFSRQASYASWALGGATRLAPDDIAIARSFRNPWRQIVSMGA